jgi:hypothetical protein
MIAKNGRGIPIEPGFWPRPLVEKRTDNSRFDQANIEDFEDPRDVEVALEPRREVADPERAAKVDTR